jgi:hypothetical protein
VTVLEAKLNLITLQIVLEPFTYLNIGRIGMYGARGARAENKE